MAYTIPNTCFGCGTCRPECPTGAIQFEDEQYWIEPGLCNGCQDLAEPQCIVACPISCPAPLEPKKGRYKADTRLTGSSNLFANDKNNPIASSMVIWEACNILTSAAILPWTPDKEGKLYYRRSVQQNRGAIAFRIADLEQESSPFDPEKALAALESIDIRAACLHLIYAAYATTLDRPWEEEFTINDRQIEQYLGLDKRKDLSRAAKLTLIKDLVQQPCKILTSIQWPEQGQIKGFTVEESPLWHLVEIKHHFQENSLGFKYLVGLTLRIRPGIWAKYFLNKQGYSQRDAFYQYGTLPKFPFKYDHECLAAASGSRPDDALVALQN